MVTVSSLSMVKLMSNKGFTLVESIFVLCLFCFLSLLTGIHLPQISYLDIEMQRIKELLLQSQLYAQKHKQIVAISFQDDALWINETRYAYTKGITSDSFSLRYYEDGTISQAKTICFYHQTQQKCFYIQLGSGYPAIR